MDTYRIVLLIGTIFLGLGGLIFLWGISKTAPRGTVLGIAAGIYLLSFLIVTGGIAELVAIVALTRFVGFFGGILGLIDVFRSRSEDSETTGMSDSNRTDAPDKSSASQPPSEP